MDEVAKVRRIYTYRAACLPALHLDQDKEQGTCSTDKLAFFQCLLSNRPLLSKEVTFLQLGTFLNRKSSSNIAKYLTLTSLHHRVKNANWTIQKVTSMSPQNITSS